MKSNSKTILFLVNVDWYFISHRLLIAQEAIANGYSVYVACQDTGRSDEIKAIGANFINLPISRSGVNPFRELYTLIYFYRVYKKVKPDIVHNISIKAVVYGSLISKLFKKSHVVNAISGLGYNFTKNRKGIIQKLIIQLLRFGFKRKILTVIFQNEDDEFFFKENRIISSNNKIVRIKGSGVDLSKYRKTKLPNFDIIKILLPSRMLWDKGVKELREASEILKPKYKGKIQFILCGFADKDNRAGVSENYLKDWQDENYVNWIGYKKDMLKVYNDCHVVVLPSYREGMPKSLIEACAVGRAIITTNAVGCRECVEEGVNGFKVPVYSSKKLAKAIENLISDKKLIEKMGENSRKKAERDFDVKDVTSKHLEIYSN
jgi:glycosyltransferase involved in cell wall biosynthesis